MTYLHRFGQTTAAKITGIEVTSPKPTSVAGLSTTTPAFLEKRFDKMTRSMVSGLFLFGYVTVLLPVVLYTGSLALITMFDLNISIWVVAAAIGLLGSSYAIFGGLKIREQFQRCDRSSFLCQ